jgi:predicted  nucleic acid-binding Zn-ribbon protein
LEGQIAEQRAILRAVKISEQAQQVLDDLEKQIEALEKAREEAEEQLRVANEEFVKMGEYEKGKISEIERLEREFKLWQSQMFVLESDVREMSLEYERQKKVAIEEKEEVVELEKAVRKGKLKAAEKFVMENGRQIHKVERVGSTLVRMKMKLEEQSLGGKVRVRRSETGTARRRTAKL